MLWSPLPGPAPCRLRPRSRPAPPPGRARWASASLSTRSARRSGRTQGRAAAGPAEAARARARISEPQGECVRTPFHLEAQSALGFVSFFAPTQASETGAGGGGTRRVPSTPPLRAVWPGYPPGTSRAHRCLARLPHSDRSVCYFGKLQTVMLRGVPSPAWPPARPPLPPPGGGARPRQPSLPARAEGVL